MIGYIDERSSQIVRYASGFKLEFAVDGTIGPLQKLARTKNVHDSYGYHGRLL